MQCNVIYCLQYLLQVFLSAEPNHWCKQPHLEDVGAELNWTHRLHLGSPLEKEEGEYRLYSKCEMYNVTDWASVLRVRYEGLL